MMEKEKPKCKNCKGTGQVTIVKQQEKLRKQGKPEITVRGTCFYCKGEGYR